MDATNIDTEEGLRFRRHMLAEWHKQKQRGVQDEQIADVFCIYTRSFIRGMGGDLCPDEAQRILAEVTGIPMVNGLYPPARGEMWLRRPGMEWDAFARRWVEIGPKTGTAINYSGVGA